MVGLLFVGTAAEQVSRLLKELRLTLKRAGPVEGDDWKFLFHCGDVVDRGSSQVVVKQFKESS